MNEFTRETLAKVDNDDTSGPWLQIDPSNQATRQQLITLRDELMAADTDLGWHAPPEAHAGQRGQQADIVVEALLASQGKPVYLWALNRVHIPGFRPFTWDGITRACDRIVAIEGVTFQNKTH